MNDLLKGQFLVTLLGMSMPFVLAMNGHLDSTQAGLTIGGIVAAFLHFDTKGVSNGTS